MATPAWPTPMRALTSKLNLSHVPGRLTDSALFNRWARRAVACIPTSSIDVAARSSCGGVQCGSGTVRHRGNAQGHHCRGSDCYARAPCCVRLGSMLFS